MNQVRRIVRAPFDGRTWRELSYALIGLILAVPLFPFAILGVIGSVLSLLTIGLPILVLALAVGRLAVRYFRAPARALLGWDWPALPPVGVRNPLAWGRAVIRDGASWRGLAYCFLKLPLAAITAYGAIVLLGAGLEALTYPAWWFISPDNGLGADNAHTWAGTWFIALQGLAAVLAFPWFLRLLVALDRLLAYALLAPGQDRTRIAALESSRAVLTADAAANLRRLERDLHDGTQARLVALGVALARVDRRVTDPDTTKLLAGARDTVTEALTELRDIVGRIHPPVLDHGLSTAMATLAGRSPVPVELADGLRTPVPDATATAVYFTAAELLTNVAKHSGATRAHVDLVEDERSWTLSVGDNGRGGARAHPTGTGLDGLARRAEALDGTFAIDSPPDGPTRIVMTLPKG